jgi:hypothetical protein
MSSRFVVGIDLGTTNSAVAYVDTEAAEACIESLPIPQLVAFGEVGERPTLPSFLYLAGEHDVRPGDLALPWSGDRDFAVGEFARQQGARVSGRLVSSAKSWLCHGGVDRQANILPWGAPEDVARISPVEASSRFLGHLRAAWQPPLSRPSARRPGRRPHRAGVVRRGRSRAHHRSGGARRAAPRAPARGTAGGVLRLARAPPRFVARPPRRPPPGAGRRRRRRHLRLQPHPRRRGKRRRRPAAAGRRRPHPPRRRQHRRRPGAHPRGERSARSSTASAGTRSPTSVAPPRSDCSATIRPTTRRSASAAAAAPWSAAR